MKECTGLIELYFYSNLQLAAAIAVGFAAGLTMTLFIKIREAVKEEK